MSSIRDRRHMLSVVTPDWVVQIRAQVRGVVFFGKTLKSRGAFLYQDVWMGTSEFNAWVTLQ